MHAIFANVSSVKVTRVKSETDYARKLCYKLFQDILTETPIPIIAKEASKSYWPSSSCPVCFRIVYLKFVGVYNPSHHFDRLLS